MPQDYGLKTSQNSFDVNDASPDQQAFNSSFNSFKIFKTSLGGPALSVTVPQATPNPPFGVIFGTIDVTVDHGLGYQPSFMLWATDSNGKWRFWTSIAGGLSTNTAPFYSGTDKSVLLLHFSNADTTQSVTLSYHYAIMLDRT